MNTKVKLILTCFLLFFICNLFADFSKDEIGYINADNVNVRKAPDIKSESLGFLKLGTWIKIIKKSDKQSLIDGKPNYWYLCQYEPGEGWIFGELITKGKFNHDKYIKSLPKLTSIPKSYYILKMNSWNNCTPKEAEEGGMGCYNINFSENMVITNFPPGNEYYQILEIASLKDDVFKLKIKHLMSDCIVLKEYMDIQLNLKGLYQFYIINVNYDFNDESIVINGKKYYKHAN